MIIFLEVNVIYLDNAATTLQKPRAVYKAIKRAMKNCANAGRGAYKLSSEADKNIYRCRESLGMLFNTPYIERICFTKNTTEALNFAVLGTLQKGGHCVIGSMEHNSVARAVHKLYKDGLITYDIAAANDEGIVTADSVAALIRENTGLIAVNHVSNVCGSISDIEGIASVSRERGIYFLVDAAQSGGVVDIDLRKTPVSLLAFAGHKGLYGPQGTGGLYIAPGVELNPTITGGTGSMSADLEQPAILPDRFESGTLNMPGIYALSFGVDYVRSRTTTEIAAHERGLTKILLDALLNMKNVTVYGARDLKKRTGVVSFNIEGRDCVEISAELFDSYGICSRAGLHCAPLAHKSLNTIERGTIRLSIGAFTTKKEVLKAIDAVNLLSKNTKCKMQN